MMCVLSSVEGRSGQDVTTCACQWLRVGNEEVCANDTFGLVMFTAFPGFKEVLSVLLLGDVNMWANARPQGNAVGKRHAHVQLAPCLGQTNSA
jgi:hypothetical protein